MEKYPGFDIRIDFDEFTYHYGQGVFGPKPEIRKLEDIRKSLQNPNAEGPENLYAIAMDVGNEEDKAAIESRNLLYGMVIYNKGMIGNEPIRSQGHIHAVSKSCQRSTCEVYEILSGEAIIYMQEFGGDHAGRCFAIHGKPKDVIIVPPNWVHATVNAKVDEPMAFGAWCVRDYGFEYDAVREHQGIAFFPTVEDGKIKWQKNENYTSAELIEMPAKSYPQFGIEEGKSIYEQFKEDPDRFLFVSHPEIADELWREF